MKFENPTLVEQVCYDMRLSDFTRGKNRARINDLFNGMPPFDEAEAERNGVSVNVNPLTGTVLAHDARAQFYGAFMKPGKYFEASTDHGPTHKRSLYNTVVSREMNKVMKRSPIYFESMRSKFAMDVLHGIAPSAWKNSDFWCPSSHGPEDIGIPSNTLLTMENLPFFYIYRSYTLPELIRLTRNARKAAEMGWNMPLVKRCIKYVDSEMMTLMGSNWPEVWSPEKVTERVKGDGGFYASDQVPTIDCFDFYFWNDEGKVEGWNRRIILDSWSTPQSAGGSTGKSQRNSKLDFSKNQFLYNPGKRKYASKLSELVAFQFADLSSVAPFRYHSVRSLGFLVYAVCHLQNRMYCKFNESVFESLMNYFRVRSMDDVDRALHVDLVNRGFVDETIQFIPPAERWQVNAALVEMGMNENRRIIDQNTNSWTQQQSQGQPGDRKTKFQVMAEMNKTTALVQSAFNQAYTYQGYEYREIARRFFKANSDDPDVREFRARCLSEGIPEKLLDMSRWEIEPVRVMGSGNKTMEMTIAEQLMQMRNLYDPDAQREILRDVTLAVTDDPDRAMRLVPEQQQKITDSVHGAQLAMGVLMAGLPVAPKGGENQWEYVQVLLAELGMLIQKYQQGGMAPPDKIEGFNMVAQNIGQRLQLLSQDPSQKQFVAESGKQLAKLMNFVKAFQQRLEEQMKKQQQSNGGGGIPPEAIAKLQASKITATAKAQNTRESHSQKAAQRQISFMQEEKRKQAQFEAEQARENIKAVHESARGGLKSVGDE